MIVRHNEIFRGHLIDFDLYENVIFIKLIKNVSENRIRENLQYDKSHFKVQNFTLTKNKN